MARRDDATSPRDAWPIVQEMIAKAAQAAGLAPDTWVPDGRPQLKQYCFKFSGPQLLHAGRRIAAQLLNPKKFVRINNPWAVLAAAAKDRDFSAISRRSVNWLSWRHVPLYPLAPMP